jgi:hypothetical protein
MLQYSTTTTPKKIPSRCPAVDDSFVGQLIVANGFANVPLHLPNSLVNFSSNLILVHGRLSSQD